MVTQKGAHVGMAKVKGRSAIYTLWCVKATKNIPVLWLGEPGP